jgi:hypothetical protein
MKKEIPIRTKDKKFYRQYLRLMAPITKLQEKESDVLAYILYYNNKYRDLPEDVKWRMVFDTSTRKVIQTELKMSPAHLANILSSLRKKKVLTEENKISAGHIVEFNDSEFLLTFKFIHDGQE